MQQKRTAVLVFSIGVLLGLSGCPTSGSNDTDTDEPTFVEGFKDTSGIIVMLVEDSGLVGFNLLDPRTNTVSENQYPLASYRPQSLAVSPDGTMLAHITPANAVLVTRFIDDGGTPNLELVQSWEGLEPRPFEDIRWNTHSNRVYTGNWWFNVETGEAAECEVTTNDFVRQNIQSDGYHVLCGGQMLTDGEVFASNDDPDVAAATGAATSADGAWITAGWQAEPLVVARVEPTDSPTGSRYVRAQPRWDATTFGADNLIYGFELTQQGGNGVVTCQENTRTDKVTYSEVVRPHGLLQQDDYFDENLWDFSGLEQFYQLLDSQVYTPLGTHPATGEIIYRVDIRRTSGRDSAGCQNLVIDSRLIAIATDGEIRSFSTQERFAKTLEPQVFRGMPWERPSPYAYDVLPYAQDSFLLPRFQPDSMRPVGFVGFVDDEPTNIAGSMMDPEGRFVWNSEFVDDESSICRRSVADGLTQCIRAVAGGTPIFVGGQGVMAGDDSSRIEIRHISHTARPPGSLLTIHGRGFGNAGSLQLGETEIPSSAAQLWTDRRIDIVVGADWPDRSVLRVKSGDQVSGEGGIERWFRVTPRISTPLDSIPGDLVLRQGLNRIDTNVEAELDWSSEPPTDDGTFWIHSYGADEPTAAIYRFRTENWSRYVRQTTIDASYDGRWAPIREAEISQIEPDLGFVEIGGDVASRTGNFRPRVGENRLLFDQIFATAPDVPNPFGIPNHVVNVGSRTFSSDRLFGNSAVEIESWSGDNASLRADTRPVFDGLYVEAGQPRGIAGIDDLLLVSLIVRMGVDYGYGLSLDGGNTFLPFEGGLSFLRSPVGILTADGPAVFGVLAEDTGSRSVFIDANGVRDAGVTFEPGADDAFSYEAEIISAGAVAIWHRPGRQLSILDLNVAPEVRTLDLGSPVENLYHAISESAVYATLEDGRVLKSPFDGASPDFQPVTFEIELADGSTMTANRVMQLSDGRTLVRAAFDTAPTWTDSEQFWVVSPAQ